MFPAAPLTLPPSATEEPALSPEAAPANAITCDEVCDVARSIVCELPERIPAEIT